MATSDQLTQPLETSGSSLLVFHNSDVEITVESMSARFNRARSERSDVVCCISVPNCLLQTWHHFGLNRDTSYVQLVNDHVRGGIITLNTNRPGCERLEGNLRRRAAEVVRRASKKKPTRSRLQYLEKSTRFDIRRGETVQASLLLEEMEMLNEDIGQWIEQYEGSRETITLLRELLASATSSTSPATSSTTPSDTSSSALVTGSGVTASTTSGLLCELNNTGRPLHQVGERQRRRKVSQLKKSVEYVLSFVKSFGLTVEDVTMTDSTGSLLSFDYHQSPPTSSSPSSSSSLCSSSSSSLSTSSVCSDFNLYQTLYLLDRFGVSDEFYHELAMTHPTLPRLYKVKQIRKAISGNIEIHRLPSSYHGAYRPFTKCLVSVLTDELKHSVSTDSVAVKISGDGAKFSKSSQFILLSFSLPFLASNSLSGYGNHTFAAVKAGESYELLSNAFEPVLTEISKLVEDGELLVGENMIKLEFFLGGDYKFLLMAMGLKAANANYACLWCEVSKDERWDTSTTLQDSKAMSRSLSIIKDCVTKSEKERMGCENEPLFEIELDHVIVDELHLLLRITDKLIDALVNRMAQLDHSCRVHCTGTPDNMSKLVTAIRSCGVPFQVWNKLDKSSGKRCPDKFEWTSINGNQRLKLLSCLPPKIPDLVGGSASDRFRQLFEDFLEVYRALSSRNPTLNEQQLHQKAKDWLELFLSLRKHYQGFEPKHVTPYMHIMVYHVPEMVCRLGSIKPFSGQGVEKNNDDAKRNYFSSNKHDAAREILVTEARLEELTRETDDRPSCVREKRRYVKSNSEYWTEGIKASRKKTQSDPPTSTPDPSSTIPDPVSLDSASTT